jgi:pimeloyl-ACP methyl ester carboxylesterase
VRAPIGEGGGYAWFANRGIGRPVAESLAGSIAWFRTWLDRLAPAGRPVVLVGFSGGATFAGGVVLADPARFAGLATLYATLPFDAGVPTTPRRLAGVPVLVTQGDADAVIPVELQALLGVPARPLRRGTDRASLTRRARPHAGRRRGSRRVADEPDRLMDLGLRNRVAIATAASKCVPVNLTAPGLL